MECSPIELSGRSRLIDVPEDVLQEFIARFNSAIIHSFSVGRDPSTKLDVDLEHIQKHGNDIKLNWKIARGGEDTRGIASFNLESQSFSLNA